MIYWHKKCWKYCVLLLLQELTAGPLSPKVKTCMTILYIVRIITMRCTCTSLGMEKPVFRANIRLSPQTIFPADSFLKCNIQSCKWVGTGQRSHLLHLFFWKSSFCCYLFLLVGLSMFQKKLYSNKIFRGELHECPKFFHLGFFIGFQIFAVFKLWTCILWKQKLLKHEPQMKVILKKICCNKTWRKRSQRIRLKIWRWRWSNV